MNRRVPVSLALLYLAQSGIELTPATLRSWVHRGHISRGSGGYCLTEIRVYLESRDTPKIA